MRCSTSTFSASVRGELVDDVSDDGPDLPREHFVSFEFVETSFKFTYASLSCFKGAASVAG